MNNLEGRTKIDFCNEWLFKLGKMVGAEKLKFQDENWEKINLPHDWSINGEFSPDNPTTARGGYLPAGIGWYRKHFFSKKEWKNKKIEIVFDGIYRFATIWINGKKVGYRPNGWATQVYDISQYIEYDSRENVISVKVDNSDQPGSRYYTGSGIYRDVSLIIRDHTFIQNYDPFVTEKLYADNSANINIITTISSEIKNQLLTLTYELMDADGKIIGATNSKVKVGNRIKKEIDIKAEIHLNCINKWSVDNPYLYTLKTSLCDCDGVCDYSFIKVGLRSINFNCDKGFLLNEERVQIKGVCLHHDNGCLGAAANRSADKRRLQIMKNMGCNAIRTAHNPFASYFLDLCDEMGILVMDEAFDEWRMPQCIPAYDKNDKTLKLIPHNYFNCYNKWHKQDLKEFIIRDRNHPSVIMWSIGNEIPEQYNNVIEGIDMVKDLKSIVKSVDQTRPITNACCLWNPGTRVSGFIDELDIAGYNYADTEYAEHKKLYPETKVVGSETSSVTWFKKRGWYDPNLFGAINDRDAVNIEDSGGEVVEDSEIIKNITRRLLIGEHSMKRHLLNKNVSGMFIWSGMDYFGEPAPYTWPSRSSYFGATDTCGFEKDSYFYYKSKWSNKPVLHLVTHWNWKGLEGQPIDIIIFTNCDKVDLFLNGEKVDTCIYDENYADHLHSCIKYYPGELLAVGYINNKEKIRTKVITAGEPYAIRLTSYKNQINLKGKELAFITADIVDKSDIIVPNAANDVFFKLDDGIKLMGVDNGDPEYVGSLKINHIPTLSGKCLLVAASNNQKGKFKCYASSKGLKSSSLEIDIQ